MGKKDQYSVWEIVAVLFFVVVGTITLANLIHPHESFLTDSLTIEFSALLKECRKIQQGGLRAVDRLLVKGQYQKYDLQQLTIVLMLALFYFTLQVLVIPAYTVFWFLLFMYRFFGQILFVAFPLSIKALFWG